METQEAPLFDVPNLLCALRLAHGLLSGAKKHWPENLELKARTFLQWNEAIDAVSNVIKGIEEKYPSP
jgi:hypothetical protein